MMLAVMFDDSKPGFNARRNGIGVLIGYRFKKWGAFLILRLLDKQTVSKSLGAHVAYQNELFNDGVRQFGALFVPAFMFFGVLANLCLLIGVPDQAFHDHLARMRAMQPSVEPGAVTDAYQLSGSASPSEAATESAGARGTDWS